MFTRLASLLILFHLSVVAADAEPRGRLDPALADSLAAVSADVTAKADFYSLSWQNDKALKVLRESGRDDPEVLWRMARSQVDIGENLEDDAALERFEQARGMAERAVAQAPDNAMAQQTLATALGRVALFKGVFKSVGLVKRVRKAALRAVALGDSMPVALYVLGRTHQKLIAKPGIIRSPLGLGWAKRDSVAFYFSRALDVSGGNMIQCRVEYADFLLKRRGDEAAVREMLEAALALPLRDEQDAPAKARAKEMLGGIQ